MEVSFHDNPDDAQFIIENTAELGMAIAKGIAEYLGVPYTEGSEAEQQALREQFNDRYFA